MRSGVSSNVTTSVLLLQSLLSFPALLPLCGGEGGGGGGEGSAGDESGASFPLLVRALHKITKALRVPIHEFNISSELF